KSRACGAVSTCLGRAHHKRLEVQLAVQKEVMNGVILQYLCWIMLFSSKCARDCQRAKTKDFRKAPIESMPSQTAGRVYCDEVQHSPRSKMQCMFGNDMLWKWNMEDVWDSSRVGNCEALGHQEDHLGFKGPFTAELVGETARKQYRSSSITRRAGSVPNLEKKVSLSNFKI
ncbi:hypothetical protein A6R68_18478, partial [Neotoma lepida]